MLEICLGQMNRVEQFHYQLTIYEGKRVEFRVEIREFVVDSNSRRRSEE